MSFTENLAVEIESVFDSKGFQQLSDNMDKVIAKSKAMNTLLSNARGLNDTQSNARELDSALQEVGLRFRNLEDLNFREKGRMQVGDMKKYKRQVEELGGVITGIDDSNIRNLGNVVRRLRPQVRGLTKSFVGIRSPLQMLFDGFDPEKFDTLGNSISGVTSKLRVLQSTGFMKDPGKTLLPDRTQMKVPAPERLPQDPMEQFKKSSNMQEIFGGKDEGMFSTGAMEVSLPEDISVADPMKQFEESSNMQSIFGQKDVLGGDGANRPEGFTPDRGGKMSRFLTRMGVAQSRINSVRKSVGRTGARMSGFKARALKGMSGGFQRVANSAQALQMRLLGLQFTMLTVAFIFGGLMAGALGAVGVFQVLGDTLKFMFLPTALNVLDVMLDLQSFVLGLDRDTRELIGNIFAWISVFAILVGIAAALLKPIVTLIGGIGTLGAKLAGLGSGGVVGGLQIIAGAMKTVGGIIAGSITAILGFFAGLAGAFLAVVTVAQRFGKMVGLVFGIVLTAIGIVVAAFASIPVGIGIAIGAVLGIIYTFRDTFVSIIMSLINIIIQTFIKWGKAIWKIIKGVVNIIQGFVSAIAALFTLQFDKVLKYMKEFGKGIAQIFWGIVDFVLAPFKAIYNAVVGNSIIPDMVNDIIDWLFKLPGKAFDMAETMVQNIINGIKGVGSGIWDAMKSVLPDFLVDALESGGKALTGVVNSAGEVIGSAGDVLGDVAGGIGDAASNLTSGITEGVGEFASGAGKVVDNLNPLTNGSGNNNNSGGQTTNNDVTVNAELTKTEETPQEEENRLSTLLEKSTNNETGSTTSGNQPLDI